jgi:putative component of toxin-antitoxin plasmid stabilization module
MSETDSLCDSSAMAADIADLMERTDPIGFADVGGIFPCDGGHAFEVRTDAGPAFRVTVTEVQGK